MLKRTDKRISLMLAVRGPFFYFYESDVINGHIYYSVQPTLGSN